MAWLQVNFQSGTLKRQVSLNILIPADSMFPGPREKGRKFKTLYLLHGFMGNHTDWLINTQIVEMSQMYNLAVIMPSGENSFYLDIEKSGRMYSEFIGKELIEFTRELLPLSDKREDTIIGGLSMGGYGALYNGLRHNEVFGHIVALSSALVVSEAVNSTDAPNLMGITRGYFEETFGDLDKVMDTDKNLEVLAKKTLESGNPPDLYFACGYNDSLVLGNRKLHDCLDEIGYSHVYEEGSGSHDWKFWNEFLRRGLDRLELVPKMGEMPAMFWIDEKATSPNPVT